jgi:hypothetical protein
MAWYWYILIPVILIATFVGVPSILISFANIPAVLVGANASLRGTGRYKLAALIAFLLQTTVAVTLSALIITYTGYMTSRNLEYLFAWIVGVIAAIYPMWQTSSRARHERLLEPDAYVAKAATHAAIPFALLVTVGITLLFVFRPTILDALFYWLLLLSGLVYLSSIVSIVIIARRRRGTDEDSRDDQFAEELRAELEKKKRLLHLLEDPETICSFGQMAYDGDGVEQSYIEAANWYRIAAEAGNARAQHNLSLMYENGEGVEQDDSESLRWCLAAANQGHAGSQNNLGVRYETGQGVRKDLLEAFRWYKKAAANGDENGRNNWLRVPAEIREQL